MNANIPLVTCITLSYKRFDLIYEAIDSVLSQDYPRIEYIVSDDGSDNFPGDAIREYIDSHKRENIERVIILHSEENNGTIINRNGALERSSGKYLINLPNDDLFYDEHVMSRLVEEFERTGANAITCRRQYVDRATGRIVGVLPDARTEKLIKQASPKKMFNCQAIASIFKSGTYLTRETALKYGVKNGEYKYIEDYPMYLRISRSGEKIHFMDMISIKYGFGEGLSTSKGSKRLLPDQTAICKNEILAHSEELNPFVRLYARFNYKRHLLKTRGNIKTTDMLLLCLSNPIGAFIHSIVVIRTRRTIRGLRAQKDSYNL